MSPPHRNRSSSKTRRRWAGPTCDELVILLLDDDPGFRLPLAANLREDGHDVQDFGRPADLPGLARLHRVRILIANYSFGGGETGLQLSRRFRAAHPWTPAILLTSYSDNIVAGGIRQPDFVRTLNKPLRYERLHDLVHQLSVEEATPR